MNGIEGFRLPIRIDAAVQTPSEKGSLLPGKVLKLFPDQTALLQIGQETLTAKVESPLKLNHQYLLKIIEQRPGEAPVYKVIKELAGEASDKELASAVLAAEKVPKNPSSERIAEWLLKNNLPIRSDEVKGAAAWILKLPPEKRENAFKAVELGFKLQLPAEEGVFRSLLEAMDDEPMLKKLSDLYHSLPNSDGDSNVEGRLRSAIKEILTPAAFMKNSDRKSTPEFVQLESTAGRKAEQEAPAATGAAPKQENTQAAVTRNIERTPPAGNTSDAVKLPAAAVQAEAAGQNEKKGDSSLPALASGTLVKELFTHVSRLLGRKEEAMMLNLLKNGLLPETAKSGALKPLLIEAAKISENMDVKDKADQLVHRLNGFSILQQENGPLMTQWLQIPIQDPALKSDLTVKWELRKKNGGKIDPAFCRILLFAELERLKETAVDIAIVNKVISISVHNDTPGLDQVSAALADELKQHLSSLGLSLSYVKIVPGSVKKTYQSAVSEAAEASLHKGVDLKI